MNARWQDGLFPVVCKRSEREEHCRRNLGRLLLAHRNRKQLLTQFRKSLRFSGGRRDQSRHRTECRQPVIEKFAKALQLREWIFAFRKYRHFAGRWPSESRAKRQQSFEGFDRPLAKTEERGKIKRRERFAFLLIPRSRSRQLFSLPGYNLKRHRVVLGMARQANSKRLDLLPRFRSVAEARARQNAAKTLPADSEARLQPADQQGDLRAARAAVHVRFVQN